MSFDDYSQFRDDDKLGIGVILPDSNFDLTPAESNQRLTDKEKGMVEANIKQNVTTLAAAHPEIEFYYFYPPYSIAYWLSLYSDGSLKKQLEAEALATKLILECDNIHLYSFNTRTDIITDLNNYINATHYYKSINSLILKWIHDGKGLITKSNYSQYLTEEKEFFTKFDYSSIFNQNDYEADLYSSALLNQELTGAVPIDLMDSAEVGISLCNAVITNDSNASSSDDASRLICTGRTDISSDDIISSILQDSNYVGAKLSLSLDDNYNYLSFEGQKIAGDGHPSVFIYNENKEILTQLVYSSENIDFEKHQYVLNLSGITGDITILLNGGCTTQDGSIDSEYEFSNIVLY